LLFGVLFKEPEALRKIIIGSFNWQRWTIYFCKTL